MRVSCRFQIVLLAAVLAFVGPMAATATAASGKEAAPSSTLWRSHIWEAMPPDLLKGPETDTLTLAYSQTDWKPFFIDSRFQTNEAAGLLLEKLSGIEEEAIDPGPFKLEEIKKSLQRLETARSALKAVEPEFADIRADLLATAQTPQPAPVASSPSVVQHQAAQGTTVSAEPASPALNAVSPALIEEKEKKYSEAFRAAAELDILLATSLVRYAAEMNPHCREERQKALACEIPMAKFLSDLAPAHSHYDALVAAYAKYRKLSREPQQAYNGPLKLRSGESGNHVRDLQKRLSQEGFYSEKPTGVFDSETQRALKGFQAAHNLDPDGVIGQRTKDWLNTPFKGKADLIAFSLKAMRQSPTRIYGRYVRINIPQFTLEYYKDGKLKTTHRVVVGKATGKQVKFQGKLIGENQTPLLTSTIEQVIANPRWYVNDRIRLELNAEAGADPDFFARHGYVQMASLHPWGQPRLFQKPGPKNALGRVKFEFPNVYAVYMHDTPKKSLFQRSRRDFSHGCIRLDKATQFAETLLADDNNPYAPKFESLFSSDRQVFIKLAEPVPIMVEYVPAGTDGSGQVVFFGDLYGLMRENSTQNQKS